MHFSDDKRIFEQVAELVERDILAGVLKPGDQAPSTNDFARVYQINPATARKGLADLTEQGLLFKKRGLGMFVSDDARTKIVDKRKTLFFSTVLPELLAEARRLGITTEEIVTRLKGAEKC